MRLYRLGALIAVALIGSAGVTFARAECPAAPQSDASGPIHVLSLSIEDTVGQAAEQGRVSADIERLIWAVVSRQDTGVALAALLRVEECGGAPDAASAEAVRAVILALRTSVLEPRAIARGNENRVRILRVVGLTGNAGGFEYRN